MNTNFVAMETYLTKRSSYSYVAMAAWYVALSSSIVWSSCSKAYVRSARLTFWCRLKPRYWKGHYMEVCITAIFGCEMVVLSFGLMALSKCEII